MNAHWHPYWSRCGYCSTNYTVIARMETFAADLAKISALAGVRLEKEKVVHSHGSSSDGHHPTTAELAHTYFTELPRKYREALYKLYKIDIDMFGYDPDIYMNL